MKSVHGEEKHEYAGPIASDSLAAESLRSGGHFAQGNPADISSVSGSKGTFASRPDPNGPHFQEILPGHKKGDQDIFETGKAGGIDDDLKTKMGRVGTLNAGSAAESFSGRDAQGNDNTNPASVQHPIGKRGDIEQHRKERVDSDEHPRLGLRGGMAPSENEEERRGNLKSFKYAPSTSTHETGTVGPKAVKQQQTPDWSKVSKDFDPTTNFGSNDDPGRVAGQRSAQQSARQYQGAKQGEVETNANPYQDLKSEQAI